MSEWTTTREGYRTKTIQYGSCTITVHRPILTAKETAERERQTRRTLENALRDYIHKR